MFGSAILDIGIGIIFVYLLLSLVVTAANELLSALFKARGKTLWRGICNLLPTGDKKSDNSLLKKNFAQAIYDHPLIDGLAQGSRPSYIPSRTFTLALLDVIAGDGHGKLNFEQLQAKIDELPDDLKKPLNILFSEAGHDVEHFKVNVEIWFNNAMDRVGGWYKRKIQYILFSISWILTLAMNVDSMLLVNRLSPVSVILAPLIPPLPPATHN